jgi:hypothetical protein
VLTTGAAIDPRYDRGMGRLPDLDDASSSDGESLASALDRLRYVLDHLREFPDDTARELYSELLDRYRDRSADLAAIRELGLVLHELERTGALPAAMVVRPRRKP